jgi:mRNA interferase RelE/StbE
MIYNIEFSDKSRKQMKRLSNDVKVNIVKYLEGRIANSPYDTGKKLKGKLAEYWRYRIGDYRVICNIDDDVMLIMVIEVGHRSKIYN